jgi:hypothetical protein
VKLRNHAFTFGNSAPGFNQGFLPPDWWISGNTPDGQQFRQKFLQNFNGIVAENCGKWNAVEYSRGHVDQSRADAVVTFAKDNNLRVRGHTHVWPSPQGLPPFADQLLTDATYPAKTQAQREAAKTAFTTALTDRVHYSFADDRGKSYMEFDVLSEVGGRHFQYDAKNPPPAPQQPLPQNRLWTAYGAAGQAAMFEQVAAAMRANGGRATLMIDVRWRVCQQLPPAHRSGRRRTHCPQSGAAGHRDAVLRRRLGKGRSILAAQSGADDGRRAEPFGFGRAAEPLRLWRQRRRHRGRGRDHSRRYAPNYVRHRCDAKLLALGHVGR